MTKKNRIDFKNYPNLVLLEGDLVIGEGINIFSPICPDYHFKKVKNPFGQSERIHDFDGMGERKGIVYEKLISSSESLFKQLDKLNVKYRHILLVADVEKEDRVMIRRLSISEEEFLRRCRLTCDAINGDLTKRGLGKSKCDLMGRYFRREKYDFYGNIIEIANHLTGNSSLEKRILKTRFPLHRFWFGISENESRKRSIHDIAMYSSFGKCPEINQGIILCADSEVLSHCYNIGKKKKTPVIYISGNY